MKPHAKIVGSMMQEQLQTAMQEPVGASEFDVAATQSNIGLEATTPSNIGL